jgi:hypothetical protein
MVISRVEKMTDQFSNIAIKTIGNIKEMSKCIRIRKIFSIQMAK